MSFIFLSIFLFILFEVVFTLYADVKKRKEILKFLMCLNTHRCKVYL